MGGHCISPSNDHHRRITPGFCCSDEAFDHLPERDHLLSGQMSATLRIHLVLDLHTGGARGLELLNGAKHVDRAAIARSMSARTGMCHRACYATVASRIFPWSQAQDPGAPVQFAMPAPLENTMSNPARSTSRAMKRVAHTRTDDQPALTDEAAQPRRVEPSASPGTPAVTPSAAR